jgi:hypothetical protein
LLAQKDLRARFNQDPEGVMTEFGLDDDERKILYLMDAGEIAKVVQTQFTHFKKAVEDAKPDAAEFPPCSEDYTPDLGGGGPEYPSPKPGIYRVRPERAYRKAIKDAGEKLEVVITGKSFRRGQQHRATVIIERLKPEVPPNPREVDKSETVPSDLYGTFRCSRLVVRLAPLGTETEIMAADYRVVVENGPDPKDSTKKIRLETKRPRGWDFKVVDDE